MFLKVANYIYIRIYQMITGFMVVMKNCSYVAMFHDITNQSDLIDKYAVEKQQYERYLCKLKEDGYNICTLESLNKRKSVLITFDDGYKSIITKVYPIMKELNLPFTLFVTIEYIGKEGYLDWQDLKILSNSSICKIGSHAVTHSMFRFMDEKQVMDELMESKKKLENELNVVVEDFAFPYGSRYAVSSANIKNANDIYKNVYMTKPWIWKNKKTIVPRLDMSFWLKYFLK